MKKINFDFKILKEPSNLWALVITTNRSAIFKPIVIFKSQKYKDFNLIGYIEGYRNYLGLGHTKIESVYLNFYCWVSNKPGQYQIYKCERYPIIELLNSKTKIVQLKDLKFKLINKEIPFHLGIEQKMTLQKMKNKKYASIILKDITMFESNGRMRTPQSLLRALSQRSRAGYNTLLKGKFKTNSGYSKKKIYEKSINFNIKDRNKGMDIIKKKLEMDDIAKNNKLITRSIFNQYTLLKNYSNDINQRFKEVFRPKNSLWHVIYFDLNVFKDMPIISSILMDNEKSNEGYWLNQYTICKKIYRYYGLNWNIIESWVSMVTSINTLSHTYVLEEKDIYMEAWFFRFLDCEEVCMAHQLYSLFIKCKCTNPELKKMQFWAKKYIACTAFWYVANPSANMKTSFLISNKNIVEKDPVNPVGHFSTLFIPRFYFHKHCSQKFNPRVYDIGNENDKDLFILFGEGTAFLYPSLRKYKKINSFFEEERTIKFLKDSSFYTHLNTFYTTDFLDDRIIGFFCGIKKKKIDPKRYKGDHNFNLKYRIPFKHLLAHQTGDHVNDSRIVFVPFPKVSDTFLKYAYDCADQRMYIPDFIFKNGKHEKCFESVKNIKGKIENIKVFLNSVCKGSKRKDRKDHVHFVIFSLDDLMKKSKRNEINRFVKSNRIQCMNFEICELMYNAFIFLIRFYK